MTDKPRSRAVQLGTAQKPDVRDLTMTPRAMAAFIEYRDMGVGRSLRRLADESRHRTEIRRRWRLNTLEDWSRTYGWQDLVMAYDTNLARDSAQRLYEKRLREIEQRREERLGMARLSRSKGFEALRDMPTTAIKPLEAVALFKYADAVEREDTGDQEALKEGPPSSATLVQGVTSDKLEELYATLSDEERARFLAILGRYQESFAELQEFIAG